MAIVTQTDKRTGITYAYETMDALTALHLYRMKDVVEKAFGNIKERLNMRFYAYLRAFFRDYVSVFLWNRNVYSEKINTGA